MRQAAIEIIDDHMADHPIWKSEETTRKALDEMNAYAEGDEDALQRLLSLVAKPS